MVAKRIHGLGETNDQLYIAWVSMRRRCNNPNFIGFKYYGGKGITVCKRWDDFTKFAADVGPHPGKGWSIDRRNSNKNYTPCNVRWSTRSTQSRNRNCTKLTQKMVNKIRALYSRGNITQQSIADAYGLDQSYVGQIINLKRWR